MALEGDGYVVAAALALAAGANLLQYSLSAGDKGINAFLGKEKGENPFYKDGSIGGGSPRIPQLPNIPFVEVRSGAASQPEWTDVSSLYKALDDAVEREAYEEAAAFKAQIDKLLAEQEERG